MSRGERGLIVGGRNSSSSGKALARWVSGCVATCEVKLTSCSSNGEDRKNIIVLSCSIEGRNSRYEEMGRADPISSTASTVIPINRLSLINSIVNSPSIL